MNYIKEINAFYDWLETNSLSTSGIALWHALMAINNKAGWITEFAVAVSVLCVKTGLAPRTINEARNELRQKGRLEWRSRKGNQSALYKLIPLSAPNADKYADKELDKVLSASCADSSADNHADSSADNHADNGATLYKLNKTKLNNKNIFPEDSIEMTLATDLKMHILRNNPSAKIPGDLNSWARVFDLMIRLDNRSIEQIRTVMNFCQSNSFWIPNILSAAKLREKYDTLLLQSQQKGRQVSPPDLSAPVENEKRKRLMRSMYS